MSLKSQLQIITLLSFFFSSICSSQSKLNLSNDLKVDIITNSYIYKTKQAYPIDTIDSLLKNNQLVRVPSKSSQGFSQEVFWIHFQLLQSELPLIIELDNPHLNNVKLYQKSNSNYELIGSGGDFEQSFKERSYNNRRFIFSINNSQFNREYILMIDGINSEVHFPLWLWSKEVFEQKESKANIYYGLFFGMLFFISFLSLITSLAVRKKIFICAILRIVLVYILRVFIPIYLSRSQNI